MTVLLIMLGVMYSRPDCPPVTDADVLNVLQREAELSRMGSITTGEEVSCPVQGRIPGRYAVGFEPAQAGVAATWIAENGGTLVRIDSVLGFAVACFEEGTDLETRLSEGWRNAGLRYVEPDYMVWITHVPNDPYYLVRQWDKYVMYADRAWDFVTGGSVKLAVVDNGVDYLHPDLAANFDPTNRGYDFVRGDNDPRPDNPAVPEAFHGTHVAGIAAAVIDNSFGVAGWAQVRLLAVRCLNDSGQGNTTDVASGIRWAVDQGARVVNLSLGAAYSPQPLTAACSYAVQQGVLLVAASGNDGSASINYPAALHACVAVGAINTDSRLASFSNYGHEQEVVAPGVEIVSTGLNGSFIEADGTSMASPQVAGIAALVLAQDPTLTLSRLRAIITTATVDMGPLGRDDRYGYGLVNARRALELTRRFESAGRRQEDSTDQKCRLVVSRRNGRISGQVPVSAGCIEVLDCAGRAVARLGPAELVDGNTACNLPLGIFFLRLGSGTVSRIGRIQIIP